MEDQDLAAFENEGGALYDGPHLGEHEAEESNAPDNTTRLAQILSNPYVSGVGGAVIYDGLRQVTIIIIGLL